MAIGPRAKARILALATALATRKWSVGRLVLYGVYGTDIFVRLMRIQAHPERDGPIGALVVALYGRTPAYVRCTFADQGETLRCEACAGAYAQDSRTPPRPISAATEAALEKAGYRCDHASGRFIFNYQIGNNPTGGNWGGAAVTVLSPLIDAFGARAGSKIDIIAPLAPERDEEAIRQVLRGDYAAAMAASRT
jgi:hypothetical protein